MKPLTDNQQRVFDFIKQYIEDNKKSPTKKEIADYMGVTTPSIRETLMWIVKKGYIKDPKHKFRKISIVKL